MFRWWLVVLVVGAIFSHFTPAAFAGCDKGESSAGSSKVAFCCGPGDAKNDARGGKSRIVSGFQGRSK